MLGLLESILLHHPVSCSPARASSSAENQGYPHSYDPVLGKHGPVSSSGFPESCGCGSVGSRPGRVFLIIVAEEVPLALLHGGQACDLYLQYTIPK